MLGGMKRLLIGLILVGCGDDARDRPVLDGPAPTIDAPAPIDAAATTLTVTSTAFAEGGAIPVLHTCKDTTANKDSSPPLTWTGGPAGTKSFAVVLTDKSIGRVHWAVCDVAPTTTQLPLNIDKVYSPTAVPGAHQVSAQASFDGYQGPCPPNQHTYEFAVYALDVTPLPGATSDSLAASLVAGIQSHALATGKLTGTFTP